MPAIIRTNDVSRNKVLTTIKDKKGISLTRIHLEFPESTSNDKKRKAKREMKDLADHVTSSVTKNKKTKINVYWRDC